jgi:hypothetical protein
MSEPGASDAPPDLSDLVLDRVDALRVLRADSHEERGALLEELAGPGKAEQDILSQLAKPRPLYRPDRFEEAHRFAVRSLEVLDRNGARAATPEIRLWILEPVVRYVVGLMTRWIVRGYQNRLIENLRELYERREANSVWGSPEHRMLRRARLDMTRVEKGFRGNPLGLPTFLVGGAVVSSLVSVLGQLVEWALGDRIGPRVAVLGTLMVVLFSIASLALFSAGVARRRIRLSCDQSISALYETIGACGDPPRDDSYNFAVYSIVLLVLAAFIVPLIVTAFLV